MPRWSEFLLASVIVGIVLSISLCPSCVAADTWAELQPAAGSPPARMAHTAVYDAARNRVVVFGGLDVSGLKNDVWALSFDPEPAWSELTPAGFAPSPRWDHAAAYDPAGDRMILFGGDDGAVRNDVWALSLSDPITWTQLTSSGTPPAGRSSHTAVLDPFGNRLIVHGGFDGIGLRDDLWALTLSDPPAWQELAPSGAAPIARRDAVAAYDSVRRRFLLHGGNAGFAPFLDDAWALDLAGVPAWSLLVPVTAAPAGAITHAGAYDVPRDRLVIFGGNYHNEAWALSLGEPIAWERLLPSGTLPAGRIDHTFVYVPYDDQFAAFGGHTGLGTLDDTWALELLTATRVAEVAPAARFVVSPNPATAEATFRVDGAPSATQVSIAVYDIAGRLVRRVYAGPWIAGAAARWDLRDADGTPAPAGVYVCELRTASAREVRRLVAVR